MANAWFHSVMCLITFSKPYFNLNKQIDSWCQELDKGHRNMGHDYYQLYGKLWDMNNPFPRIVKEHCRKTRQLYGDKEAEIEAVRLCHSYVDRAWDEMPEELQTQIEVAYAEFALNPKLLKDLAGIDVIDGKILYEFERGMQLWVDDLELSQEYRRLAKYIRIVLRNQYIKMYNM